MQEMLNFSPDMRPTAEQLLLRSFFDDIRVPENEVKAAHKIQINIDKNECKFDYEEEKINFEEKDTIHYF